MYRRTYTTSENLSTVQNDMRYVRICAVWNLADFSKETLKELT